LFEVKSVESMKEILVKFIELYENIKKNIGKIQEKRLKRI